MALELVRITLDGAALDPARVGPTVERLDQQHLLVVSEIAMASSMSTTQIERKITSTLSACFKDVKVGLDA